MIRVLVGIAVALGCAAFARSQELPAFAALGALALAASMTRPRPHAGLSTALAVLTWITLISAAIVTWALLVVLMVRGEDTDLAVRVVASIAAALATALLVIGREGLAAVLGVALLDLAGLHREAEVRPFVLSAALALLLSLARPRGRGRWIATVFAIGIASAIATTLPPAQRAFEKAAFAALAPRFAKSGLSGDDASLGDVESLALSDRLVLRMWSDAPVRLRARAYLHFDGRTWHTAAGEASIPKSVEAPPNLAAYDVTGSLLLVPKRDEHALQLADVRVTRIVPVDLDESLLPSPGDALALKAPFTPSIDEAGIVLPLTRVGGDSWSVVHRARGLLADDHALDTATRIAALSLPPRLDPRLRALAASLAEGTTNDAQKIERTVEWIRTHAHYDLDVGRFKTRDPVAEFLFDKKRGYCEYFASALALLLRIEGVPTRFVTGFAVSDDNRVGRHFEVRDADAHAWVEAHVEGRGWIMADATPPAELASLHPHPKTRWQSFRAWLADVWASFRGGGPRAVVRGLGIVAFAALFVAGVVVVVREIQRRRAARSGGDLGARAALSPDVARCVAAIDRTFVQLGSPRPRASGLLEHARTLDTVPSALERAIDVVHRSAFAGEEIDRGSLRETTRALAKLRPRELR